MSVELFQIYDGTESPGRESPLTVVSYPRPKKFAVGSFYDSRERSPEKPEQVKRKPDGEKHCR
jgi:hypothetical protein